LYAGSTVTCTTEAEFAGRTYAEYLSQWLPLVPEKDRLLANLLRARFLPGTRPRPGIP
jgi:hypothetical protein